MPKVILFLCFVFGTLFAEQDVSLFRDKKKSAAPAAPVEQTSTEETPPPAEPEKNAPPPVTVKTEEKLINESYWKFHHSAYIGYRRDRQQFNAFGSSLLNTRTQVKNRNSVILTASSHAEIKNIVGYITGSYGWLINGYTDFEVPGNAPPLDFPSFKLGAGYQVDVRGAVGYRFSLLKMKNLQFSLVPGAGYRYAHMMNDSEGMKRSSLPGTNNFAYSQFPKPNQQDWFGPYIDGRLEFLCWNFFEWDFFGQYHWPYLVSKSSNQIEIYSYNAGGVLTSDQLNTANSVLKSGDLHMLLGGTHMKWAFGTGWAVGTYFEGATTWGHGHNHVHLKQEQMLNAPIAVTNTQSKDPSTIRWIFWSLSVMADHRF